MATDVNDELEQMQKRIEELEQRLNFFEQLVYKDYLRLLALYRDKLTYKHYLM